jgi:hypothetical protein
VELFLAVIRPAAECHGSNCKDLLRGFMQAITDPCFCDEIVIAHPNPDPIRADNRMDGDIHPRLKLHGFIIANSGPLNKIVPLAMSIETRFRRRSFFYKEFIVGTPDLRRVCPWLEEF